MTMPATVSSAASAAPGASERAAASSPQPVPGHATVARQAAILWPPALAAAALGAWLCVDAAPGLNWTLLTFAMALGLLWVVRRSDERVSGSLRVALGAACALGACAAITADFDFAPVILLGVAVLLAIAMALAEGVSADAIGPLAFVIVPVGGFFRTLREAVLRVIDLAGLPKSSGEKAQARMRGALLAIPVVGALALMLSGADPVLARLRDDLLSLGQDQLLIPRAMTFAGVCAITAGAYGIALRRGAVARDTTAPSRFTLGDTERFMVLSSVSALFALFLGLQVSYFFGDLPALAGSGFTYAEYARNGFGELTFAATAATVLIVWLDQHAKRSDREGRARVAGLVLIFLVQLLLDSAYHRVSLYEAAYGYTASRLYARIYMMIVSVALVALGIEIWTKIDVARLSRRVGLLGVAAVITLCCWNHEAWIVRRNVDRFVAPHYGQLDTDYLLNSLSPNAVPEIVRELPRIPGSYRDALRGGLEKKYSEPGSLGSHWYEFTWRGHAARSALASIGITAAPKTQAQTVGGG